LLKLAAWSGKRGKWGQTRFRKCSENVVSPRFTKNRIKEALEDPSKTVGLTRIKFKREEPGSSRPDSLQVFYTIDGKTKSVMFENEARKIPEIIE